jgi:hypothetical protein
MTHASQQARLTGITLWRFSTGKIVERWLMPAGTAKELRDVRTHLLCAQTRRSL